jgi:hypothetical protein
LCDSWVVKESVSPRLISSLSKIFVRPVAVLLVSVGSYSFNKYQRFRGSCKGLGNEIGLIRFSRIFSVISVPVVSMQISESGLHETQVKLVNRRYERYHDLKGTSYPSQTHCSLIVTSSNIDLMQVPTNRWLRCKLQLYW